MPGPLTPAALRARIRRLEQISDGFTAELSALSVAGPALSAEERERYRRGLLDAFAAIEQARHALIEALGRARPTA
jgi:hypothetical protein